MRVSSAIAVAGVALAVFASAASSLVACGSSSKDTGGDGGAGSSSGASSSGMMFNAGGSSGGGDGATQETVAVTPAAPTVTVVTGDAVLPVQFSATLNGTKVAAAWSIDQAQLGSINPTTGVFTPSGLIGGTAHVTATVGTTTGTTTVTVVLQTVEKGDPAYATRTVDAGAGGYEGVGGNGPGAPPSSAQVTTLGGTPTADATVSLLYPYTGTVWPQGLLAPLLQWNQGSHTFDSVYVDLKENEYEFKGYFAANATPFVNLPIPEGAWTSATSSNGGTNDPLTLTVIFGQGTQAYGPYTETWTVAQTTLQGTIYYNSYGTQLVKNSDSTDYYGQQYGAATLGIAPGATAPALIAGVNSPPATQPTGTGANQPENGTGCRVCHTVSADGKALVTQASNANAGDYSRTVYIDLANDTTGGAGTSTQATSLTFPAFYKDGSLLVSGSGFAYDEGSSLLYATPAGTLVAGAAGLPAGFQGALPAFSPDGQHMSFNFYGGTLTGDAGTFTGDQNSLGILDFDGTSTFSNPRVLYTPTNGNPVIYSSFLPSSTGIVFEVELSNTANSWGYTWNGNTSELWWVDVASKMAHRLDQLDGYDSTGAIYLPGNATGSNTHPQAQEPTLNYEPTVGPVAGGGYAWVVFTSRRMYGNVAQSSPWTSDPRTYPWRDPTQITDKKLWVAAVNLNATPGTDPSHPAFYLPAQELLAGNSRGYWALQACQADGVGCVTGTQCCGGYCQFTEGAGGDAGALYCTSHAPPCSATYEKCVTTSDCCAGGGVSCIDGVCSLTQPPQ